MCIIRLVSNHGECPENAYLMKKDTRWGWSSWAGRRRRWWLRPERVCCCRRLRRWWPRSRQLHSSSTRSCQHKKVQIQSCSSSYQKSVVAEIWQQWQQNNVCIEANQQDNSHWPVYTAHLHLKSHHHRTNNHGAVTHLSSFSLRDILRLSASDNFLVTSLETASSRFWATLEELKEKSSD